MLLLRSPTLVFALISSLVSLALMIITFHLGFHPSNYQIQFLIIFPPINSLFLFLFSLTWIERRFRLSYIPVVCLIVLFLLSLTLAIVSSQLFSVSILLYFNFLFYSFFALFFFLIIFGLLIFFLYLKIIRRRPSSETGECPLIQLPLKSWKNDPLILYLSTKSMSSQTSALPGDIDLILTLDERKDSTLIHYSHPRTHIDHLFYPNGNEFLPKSISDYMQFFYNLLFNVVRLNRHRLLIKSAGDFGRLGMTIVCLDLFYQYLTDPNEEDRPQTCIERLFHYPLALETSCRVCHSIGQLQRSQSIDLFDNPFEIVFVHEVNARLKSPSYMEQIKDIFNLNEKLFSNSSMV